MSIGKNIKIYRTKKGLTQPELGKLIHKSESSIRKYESGNVTPSIDILNKLADTLDISINDLVEDVKIQLNGKTIPTDDKLNKEIGSNIKKFREEKTLTQKELGNAIDSDENMIKLYENGYKGVPLQELKKISLILGVSENELLGSDYSNKIKNILSNSTNILQNRIDKINSNALDGLKSLVIYASLEDEFNNFLSSKPSNERIYNLLDKLSEFLEFELYKIEKEKNDK
ncbi:helix-turn-helix domain-containing protein [Clostridium felsineum]|uniref:helix-turn-helix domain-containing protein n=1 Tax=Clostridium felsineum TaxID=36839 RepID=UPI0009D0CAC8|nr:helix-turn-helix transcriptional regulator [Clostridium felsineum]URZ02738.1 hypothetical protein CLAUR_027620 [Clostridium felsineum]